MQQRGVDALELGHVVGVGDVHRTEIFRAESGEALLCNGDSHLFDAVDMGYFGKDFFLVWVEGEEGEILSVEQAQDILVQVEENLVEITGRVNLSGNLLDVFCEITFLLQFLEIVGHRLGLHPDSFFAQLVV